MSDYEHNQTVSLYRRTAPLSRSPCYGTLEIVVILLLLLLLWTPAHRKPASMLYFANVLFIFYGHLILRPWLTEVRESFTRDGP